MARLTKGYKKTDIIKAFQKMPQYRRGFDVRATRAGGKIWESIKGGAQTKITGRGMKGYLKKKLGYGYDKRGAFFKALEEVTGIPQPIEKEPKKTALDEKIPESRQKTMEEKIAKEGWKVGGKIAPKEREVSTKPAEWMKEIGRSGIKFEQERKIHSFGSKSTAEAKMDKIGQRTNEGLFEKKPPPETKTPQKLIEEEKQKHAEFEKLRQEDIQKFHQIDEKEKEEEKEIGSLLEEKFGETESPPLETEKTTEESGGTSETSEK